MHHHTENEERGVNLSFLNVSRPGEFSRVEKQAPLLNHSTTAPLFHTTKWRVWAVVPCAVVCCDVV